MTSGAKTSTYYRIMAGGDRLKVHAEGPVTLAIHFRALQVAKSSGTLRIIRDDGPFSDNAYTLDRDTSAVVDAKAASDANAASAEKVIHVQVADGAHRFELSNLKGPPLVVRVYKTAKYDPSLAPQPEKNTGAPTTPPDGAADDRGRTTATPTVASESPSTAPMQGPPAPGSTQASQGSGILLPHDLPREEPSPILDFPAAAEPPKRRVELIEESAPDNSDADPSHGRNGGFGLAARGGAQLAAGYPGGSVPGSGSNLFTNRAWEFPAELEVAWDINRVWSLYADAEYFELHETQHQSIPTDPEFQNLSSKTYLQVVPVSVGLTIFAAMGPIVGLRFRLGAAGAWAQNHVSVSADNGPFQAQPLQHSLAYGGVGGLSLDFAAGPGHVTLEGRYLLLLTNLDPSASSTNQSLSTGPAQIGGVQLLAGYRLEL